MKLSRGIRSAMRGPLLGDDWVSLFTGSVAEEELRVQAPQLTETKELLSRALGNRPHVILDSAPESLLPTATSLLELCGKDAIIPRLIVLPAGTDLRTYSEERRILCGPGIAVVNIGSPELKYFLGFPKTQHDVTSK